MTAPMGGVSPIERSLEQLFTFFSGASFCFLFFVFFFSLHFGSLVPSPWSDSLTYFSVTTTSKQLTFRTLLSSSPSSPSRRTISSTVLMVRVRKETSQSPCCSNQLARLSVFSIALPVPMTVTARGLASEPSPAAVLVLRLSAATRD